MELDVSFHTILWAPVCSVLIVRIGFQTDIITMNVLLILIKIKKLVNILPGIIEDGLWVEAQWTGVLPATK